MYSELFDADSQEIVYVYEPQTWQFIQPRYLRINAGFFQPYSLDIAIFVIYMLVSEM